MQLLASIYCMYVCTYVYMDVVCIRVLHECIQKGNLIIDNLHSVYTHLFIYYMHMYIHMCSLPLICLFISYIFPIDQSRQTLRPAEKF